MVANLNISESSLILDWDMDMTDLSLDRNGLSGCLLSASKECMDE